MYKAGDPIQNWKKILLHFNFFAFQSQKIVSVHSEDLTIINQVKKKKNHHMKKVNDLYRHTHILW